MPKVRILAVAGSLREGSYNKQLLAAGVAALVAAGAEVDVLDLREMPMPLYDGDLEDAQGLPPGAVAFKARLAAADGFLIASPEYNHSIPGTFKNALDWASRGEHNPFEGKVAALMAASTGSFGGLRMLPHLRQVLTALGVWLLPGQVTLPKAHEAFGAAGGLKADYHAKQVDALARELVEALAPRVRA